MDQIEFKETIIKELEMITPKFEEYYINKEYLVFSKNFINKRYYIISTNKDNFMHLTGVKYSSALEFYNKCINKVLTKEDIVFKNENEKGNIKRKSKALYKLIGFFKRDVLIQEDFKYNTISCSIVTTDYDIMIGFCKPNNQNVVKPKTFLNRCKCKTDDVFKIDLILSRNKGDTLFDKIIQGDKRLIKEYDLVDLVTKELLE